MTVERVAFDVGTMIADVADAARPLAAKKGNRLVVDLAPDLGGMHSDEMKIRQCLLNLVGNAAKFTQDGTVTLRCARFGDDGEDWVSFSVEDTGNRDDARSAEPAVPALRPGRRFDDAAVRRHGARPVDHPSLLPQARRRRDRRQPARFRLDLHDQPAGAARRFRPSASRRSITPSLRHPGAARSC